MKEEDTKVADMFDKDIENFGKDLDKMIEHLNIVIATHNKQVEEIERLNNLLKETSQILSEQTTKAITLKSENERLNNIINEVRELIKRDLSTDETNNLIYSELLDIIDKENK